ncbi:hypothetical protein [Nitrosomonas sp. Nm34]|uniref:hypothetical protein n=1 Tax=Nitrosomonas sp. Nm34 TaxID=1881055 RepID=UPI0008F07632|nr:hypothetical protein [Nitrosomonas sp. Nm34]SFJ11560.1 hypothetical protein SAMN05428978_11135 [Nitrosomonas sp. Nm34]
MQYYEALKTSKASEDPIYFMDATYPHHNPVAGYGRIKRGQDHEIRSHTGRQRLNINGAINTVSLQAIVRYDDPINAQIDYPTVSANRGTPSSSKYSHYL